MAIVVTSPETVNDADTTELYALEITYRSFLMVIQTPCFDYDEGDYILEEAAGV